MRSVIIDAHGPPSVMRVADVADPAPGEGAVLVRVEAAGVNFVDLLQRSGAYTVSFPFTPGIEGSGTVLATGPAVTGVAPGDRVAWSGGTRSYASHCAVPAARCVPVPADVPLPIAAAVLTQGMTAHFLTSDVVSGDWGTCLVRAAAGGVGGLICQLASARGATVIGVVSRPAKAPAARAAGATHVISGTPADLGTRVMELTGGRGVDAVFDATGEPTFGESLACLRPRGTFVCYGQTGGPLRSVDPAALNRQGSVFFTKASLSHYDHTRDDLLRRAGEVFRLVRAGTLRPRLHGEYPLADAAAAHGALASRTTAGKILLRPQ